MRAIWTAQDEPEPQPAWWERDPRVWALVLALNLIGFIHAL